MNTFATLIRREWMQHRLGWSLLVAVPLALAVLGLLFGQIELDAEQRDLPLQQLAPMLTLASVAGSMVIIFMILGITSLFLMSGLARRDHGDRSVEFWLSLPTSHSASLAAPLLTHLLLVPAAALGIGLLVGGLVSALVVTRQAGFGAWLALPWPELLAAGLALLARGLAGLPLALLWASPLLLAVVLAGAWFKRWGLPVLLLGFGLAVLALDRVFGEGATAELFGQIFRNAGQALFAATPLNFEDGPGKLESALRGLPGWAWQDFSAAVRAVAQPLFLACVAAGAGLFAALVDWRRRGASAAN